MNARAEIDGPGGYTVEQADESRGRFVRTQFKIRGPGGHEVAVYTKSSEAIVECELLNDAYKAGREFEQMRANGGFTHENPARTPEELGVLMRGAQAQLDALDSARDKALAEAKRRVDEWYGPRLRDARNYLEWVTSTLLSPRQ